MGREIRRVPRGWEHPKDDRGDYRTLYDEPFTAALEKWLENYRLWEQGRHPDQLDHREGEDALPRHWWEWDGGPPDPEYHRPEWDEEPTCYQIYETVTEGTPVSPVFETLAEMEAWLVSTGTSPEAAAAFAKSGWVPSMVFTGQGVIMGIEAAKVLKGGG